MSCNPFFLADAATREILASWRISGPATLERIIIIGAIGLVTLVALLWAVFLRKRRRRRKYHHAHQSSSKPPEVPKVAKDDSVPSPQERRRHRRRSGHRHRPRNPTLAETGGLPPVRPESPPETQP
jgi:type VI protein secretion system component VasK